MGAQRGHRGAREVADGPVCAGQDGVGAGGRLVRGVGGYLLSVDDGQLDSLQFRELADAGREAADKGELPLAAALLKRALGLWNGPALPELRRSRALSDEAERLDLGYFPAAAGRRND